MMRPALPSLLVLALLATPAAAEAVRLVVPGEGGSALSASEGFNAGSARDLRVSPSGGAGGRMVTKKVLVAPAPILAILAAKPKEGSPEAVAQAVRDEAARSIEVFFQRFDDKAAADVDRLFGRADDTARREAWQHIARGAIPVVSAATADGRPVLALYNPVSDAAIIARGADPAFKVIDAIAVASGDAIRGAAPGAVPWFAAVGAPLADGLSADSSATVAKLALKADAPVDPDAALHDLVVQQTVLAKAQANEATFKRTRSVVEALRARKFARGGIEKESAAQLKMLPRTIFDGVYLDGAIETVDGFIFIARSDTEPRLVFLIGIDRGKAVVTPVLAGHDGAKS